MSMRFRDHLAKKFQEQHGKKAKTEITGNDRAMLKLLKEAERVKQVLSANTDHFAQVRVGMKIMGGSRLGITFCSNSTADQSTHLKREVSFKSMSNM